MQICGSVCVADRIKVQDLRAQSGAGTQARIGLLPLSVWLASLFAGLSVLSVRLCLYVSFSPLISVCVYVCKFLSRFVFPPWLIICFDCLTGCVLVYLANWLFVLLNRCLPVFLFVCMFG